MTSFLFPRAIEAVLAFACSWAEMERLDRPEDDPYYQGYVRGMAEMIHLIYEGDSGDTCDEIEEYIKADVKDRRKYYKDA